MIQFRDGFYADIRIEDRSRTVISYKAGTLEEMRNRIERQAFLRVYDGKLWYYASVTDVDHLQKTLDGLYAAAEENPHILEDPIVRRFEKNRDKILKDAEDAATRQVRLWYVIEAIAKAEKIEADDKEIGRKVVEFVLANAKK